MDILVEIEPNKIKKSNMLINAKYDLGYTEQRIIFLAIAFIKDENNRTVEIPLSNYKKKLSLESFNSTHFNSVLKKLKQNTIIMTKVNKKTKELEEGIITGWVDKIVYKNAIISITFNEDIWEHLINLKERYTQYDLDVMLSLKSKYAMRLFEVLKSFEYIGIYTIKIDEFREILYIGNKYNRFNDFTDKILLPVVKEINEANDIIVSCRGIKVGVKYDSLRFTINKQKEIDSSIPPEVVAARGMSESELFVAIKTILALKYQCKFDNQDSIWADVSKYNKYALESTYLSLMADEWKVHTITNHKAFFAEHLKRLSEL